MKRLGIIILMFICLILPTYAAETKYTLSNGLTVFLMPDKSTPAVAVYVSYKVGSRNEITGKTGISHILEHLLFRGTEHFPENQLNTIFFNAGADYNAFTSYDTTAYHEAVPAEYLEKALALEADRMNFCTISKDSFKKEQSIVINELDMYDNEDSEILFNEMMSMHFRNHTYRNPVIGYKTDLQKMTREDVYKYYKTYYAPNNAALIISGNFDKTKATALVKKYFGIIPKGPEVPEVRTVEPEPVAAKNIIIKRNSNSSILKLFFPAPKMTSKDYIPLYSATRLLTSGKSSRLYKALVDRGIASSVSGDLWESKDPGIYSISVQLMSPDKMDLARQTILDEIEKLKTTPPSNDELEKTITKARAGIVQINEDPAGKAFSKGYYWALGDENHVNKILDNLKAITPKQISDSVSIYLLADKSTTGALLSTKKTGASSEAQSNSGMKKLYYRQNSAASKTSPLSALLKYEKFKLSNGITVAVRELPEYKSVTVNGFIRNAGSIIDKKNGTSYLTTGMLKQGTQSRKAEEINLFEDKNAISLTFGSLKDRTDISGWALVDKLDGWIDNFSDILLNPSFDENEFNKIKKQKISLLSSLKDDTNQVAFQTFAELFYTDGDPMGKPNTGTADSLTTVELGDVKSFYSANYRPENMTLIFVGGVTAKELQPILEKKLGSWKNNETSWQLPETSVRPLNNNVFKSAYMENKPQNVVLMGHEGVSIKSKDYTAFTVVNNLLGGSALTSRLGKDIRISKGMVYFIGSNNRDYANSSQWFIAAGLSEKNVLKAENDIKKLLRETSEKGFTQEEMKAVKSNIKNKTKVNLTDASYQAGLIRQIEFFDLPANYLEKSLEEYDKVTADDMKRLMKKYIHPDKMITVVSGSYKDK